MNKQLQNKIRLSLQKLSKDNAGATSVVFALALPAIIGACVLMTEVGFWRMKQANLQATADMAALAGAYQYTQAENKSHSKMAAYADAQENAFDPIAGVITTNIPPINGSFSGQDAVQVTITQEIPTFMSTMFLKKPIIATVNAVAKVGGESVEACVLALASNGTGLSIGGSVSVSTAGCGLHANSTSDPAFTVSGAAEIEAACASSSGGTNISGSKPKIFTDCPLPLSNRAAVRDPYADIDVPQDIDTEPCQSPTTSGNGNNATMSFPDANGGIARICSDSIDLRGTIELQPGTYVFDGTDLQFGNNGVLVGDDVTIIFRNDAEISSFNGRNGMDISAPDTGDYAGIAIYADRNTMTSNEWTFNGNADLSIYGAIYVPTLDIRYSGGSGTNATECTQLVANRVTFIGNSGFENNCDPAGTDSIFGPGASKVVLVE